MTEPTTWPPADEMRARNDEVLAERLQWPSGALAQVRELRAKHPGWNVTWSSGEAGSWREPGYYAWPATYTWPARRFIHRAEPDELAVVLEMAPEPEPDWSPPGGWLPLS
jgi:hypothetical protein